MSIADQLDAAIAAHSQWKARLRRAIAVGQFDSSVDVIRGDSACAFGIWLNGMPESHRATTHYLEVRTLHAAFHLAAADVATCAIDGRIDDAEALMSMKGSYTRASARLTRAMVAWKADAGGKGRGAASSEMPTGTA